MLTVFSPAKINLFLRVLGKRLDGYHELSTLMQTVDLGDDLHIQLNKHDSLTVSGISIPCNSSNLVLKAANLFRQKTGIKDGLKVHVKKRIPIQAGLGGGSSNAATTLWAFNQLVGNLVKEEELQAWSAEIGSDIPFFFSSGTAYCEGRGEVVTSVPSLKPQSCWLVKPCIGLSTPDVFRRLQARSRCSLNHSRSFPSVFKYENDLEQPAFELCPELRDLKIFLSKRGFEAVLMSGSGSAFFCLGQGERLAPSNHLSYQAYFVNRNHNGWYKPLENITRESMV